MTASNFIDLDELAGREALDEAQLLHSDKKKSPFSLRNEPRQPVAKVSTETLPFLWKAAPFVVYRCWGETIAAARK